jgi:RNAse (barnase) inhibitor barstar
MKSCTIDGDRIADAAAVYRELGAAFDAPGYFGANPDALWDAITEYGGEPVEIVWLGSARSAEILGPSFREIVTVLREAAAEGRLKLRLE